MKEKIAAVVVAYNPDVGIFKNINAIAKQVDKVIIVDNASNTQSINLLKQIENDMVEVVYNNENLGIATALNIGVKLLEKKYSWIVTMDQDSVADSNMIENMLYIWRKLPETEREETLSLFPNFIDSKVMNSEELLDGQLYEYVDAEITSGNMLNVEAFSRIGYFDESLFIDMVDTDFCMRLVEKNIKMIKVKNAILYHSLGQAERVKKGFLAFNTTNHSPLRRYYMTRNRLYTWKKYKHLASFTLQRDKKLFWKEIAKIILGEKQKLEKIKMMIYGYIHYKKGVRGKMQRKGK